MFLEAANKLKLEIKPHECPYKVSWLNKGQHVIVNKQAWVTFSIGGVRIEFCVTFSPWMLGTCSLVGHGNLIER